MFKYEMHLHSCGCSACAVSTSGEMVYAAWQAGYQGVVFTNHFYHGNTCIDRNLSWEEFTEAYRQDYLHAKEIGRSLDIDVLFGIEEVYEEGKEILIYGIEPELIARTPSFKEMNVYEMSDFVRSHGGFVACAHPFRERSYIPNPDKEPDPAFMDAVEVFNLFNSEEMNAKALAFAAKYHLPGISGGDVHNKADFGHSGLDFTERIRDNRKLCELLKKGSYTLITE